MRLPPASVLLASILSILPAAAGTAGPVALEGGAGTHDAMTTLTVIVRPDGSGDYPTIQAAVDAVSDGDTILLADGVFTGDGNRDVDFSGKAITIRSELGDPAHCIIDCEGNAGVPHRAFRFASGETAASRLAGVTLRNGWVAADPGGGALLCQAASSPVIEGCTILSCRQTAVVCTGDSRPCLRACSFSQNLGDHGGAFRCTFGALEIEDCVFTANGDGGAGGAGYGYASSVEITGCRFERNAAGTGGALCLIGGGIATLRDCRFLDNTAASTAGAIFLFCFMDGRIEDCTFAGNHAVHAGAVSTGKMTTAHLVGCTLWGNEADFGSALSGDTDRPVLLENSILAAGRGGAAVHYESDVFLRCCDVHGNEGGDWVGCIAGQQGLNGNLALDPLFCDAPGGDFTLDESSPCAPAQAGDCGLIGAWEVGCGMVATRPRTWGGIKASFR